MTLADINYDTKFIIAEGNTLSDIYIKREVLTKNTVLLVCLESMTSLLCH